MENQQEGSRDVIAFVVRHMACDACGEAYAEDNVCVVLHTDEQLVLEACCEACHAQQVITAYDRPPYEQLHREEPVVPVIVTQDDVEGWSAFLAGFTGDVYDLLAQS